MWCFLACSNFHRHALWFVLLLHATFESRHTHGMSYLGLAATFYAAFSFCTLYDTLYLNYLVLLGCHSAFHTMFGPGSRALAPCYLVCIVGIVTYFYIYGYDTTASPTQPLCKANPTSLHLQFLYLRENEFSIFDPAMLLVNLKVWMMGRV